MQRLIIFALFVGISFATAIGFVSNAKIPEGLILGGTALLCLSIPSAIIYVQLKKRQQMAAQ